MAAGAVAGDTHAQQNGILIVVNAYFDDLLNQAACRTLVPETLAASAPIVCLTGHDGLCQRLLVHVSQHQYITGSVVRRNAGEETVAVESWCQDEAFFYLFDRRTCCEETLRIDVWSAHMAYLGDLSGTNVIT